MKSVFWKDVFNFDYEDRIESEGVLARLFIIFLIPVKFITLLSLVMTVMIWVFSGFGIILIMANLVDYNEIGVLGWIILFVDIAVLFGLIFTKTTEN